MNNQPQNGAAPQTPQSYAQTPTAQASPVDQHFQQPQFQQAPPAAQQPAGPGPAAQPQFQPQAPQQPQPPYNPAQPNQPYAPQQAPQQGQQPQYAPGPPQPQYATTPPQRAQDDIAKSLPFIQEMANDYDAYRQWKAQQQQSQQQSQQQPQQPTWQVPQVSDLTKRLQSAGLIYIDQETGLYTSSDLRFAANVNEANQQASWRSTVMDRVATDPMAFLKEAGLTQELTSLEQRILEAAEKRFSRASEAREMEDWFSKNEREMYAADQAGNILYDQTTGEPALSQRGSVYAQASAYARSTGIDDDVAVHKYAKQALQMYDSWQSQAQAQTTGGPQAHAQLPMQTQAPQVPQTPQAARAAQQDAFMNRVQQNGHVNRLSQSDMTVAAQAAQAANPPASDDDLWEQTRKTAMAEIAGHAG